MPRIRLIFRKPVASEVELFTYPDDIDSWTETDSGTVTISHQTVISRPCMRFITTAVTEGVYKDFTVTENLKVSCSFFVRCPNSYTWTSRTSAVDNSWRSVTYGSGLFVAVGITGTGNRVMTSPDGITWTSRTSAVDNSWQSVTYGNGLFVAVSTDGTSDRVMTSPDGITWTSRTSAVDNQWRSVTYGNGLFVAVSSDGTGDRVMTSPDGITWTSRTSAVDNQWRSVTYGSGLFVAVGISGTGNRVMTSPDGITWTSRTSAVDNQWLSVAYGSGLFVAVSSDGTSDRVMTSPDGITWTSRTSAVDNSWRSVAYGEGLFVAVSNDGTGNRVMTNAWVQFTAIFHDQTNNAAITTYYPTLVDTTWRCYEVEVTVPAGCTTVRVTLNGREANTYEIDNFAFNLDELSVQAFYNGSPNMVGVVKQALGGNRIQHRLATHWRYSLNWNFVEDALFDRLVTLYKSSETLYLDDGDVDDLTEQSTIYTNATYDLTGITIPSTTHVGYYTESADLPTSAAQFQDTEYPDTWYTDIADDTVLRSHEYGASGYLYHKFIFRPSEYGTSVQRLAVRIKSVLDDLAAANVDGVIVYAWDGSSWKELFRTSSNSIEDITWYTYAASEGQSMVPQDGVASNGIVRILVRTRPYGGLVSDVAVSVYLSGNQSLTANTIAKVAFDTETYDDGGDFDADTDYSFTAPGAGLYLVSFHTHFQVNSADDAIHAFLRVNGSDVLHVTRAPGTTEDYSFTGTQVLNLNAGDKLTLWVRNDDNNDTLDGGFRYETNMTITGLASVDTSTTLGMYYVSLETNPGLGSVEPTHRMHFPTNSEADDIVVKNRTDGITVTTKNYTIDYEDNEIDLTGQDDGDVIQYTYSRFREVRIAQMPIRRLTDAPDGSVRRGIYCVLETIVGEGGD